MTLQEYLSGQMAEDRHDLSRVEAMIADVTATLVLSYRKNAWPYRIERNRPLVSPPKLSQSTAAMSTVALFKALGRNTFKRSDAKFPSPRLSERQAIEQTAQTASHLVLAAITTAPRVKTASGTYGPNDPFSLPFIAELACVNLAESRAAIDAARAGIKHNSEKGTALRELQKALQASQAANKSWRRVSKFLTERAENFLRIGPDSPADLFSGKSDEIVANAVIPLKAAQLIRWTLEKPDLHQYQAYFERTLHEHLSFSSIPDSRFDPAELAFALEGLLLCQTHAVDPTLFRRVVEVLGKAQEESAFWRPAKPFMAKERGWSLFPVSVEVANSLLRSCDLFDDSERQDALGSVGIDLFRRYWQWLRARTMRFKADESDFVGWHSEHVNETGTIHIWSTSQILEFLIAYRHLLQSHIARTTLTEARFKVDQQAKSPKPWDQTAADMEPVTSLGADYAVYERIGNEFIRPWQASAPKNFSLLLYGPPGTGKTTVAESIAIALGRPIVTITVSDFLGAGGGEVESRAKAIFDVLLSQPECVVLFDEIDAFLLDRDSEMYGRQETVFQFMTPGMLTKLNDLRRSERLIFIVATNYESRIDLAIKRTGRIDQKYLVLPPDEGARKRILTDLLRRSGLLKGKAAVDSSEMQRLSSAAIFLGYKDMEAAVKKVSAGMLSIDRLESDLMTRARTTSLSAYRAKFSKPLQPCPYEEFLCLLAMLVREVPSSSLKDKLTLQAVSKGLREGYGELDGAVRNFVPSLPAAVRSSVVDALRSAGQDR